jgi:RecA-family ATPase
MIAKDLNPLNEDAVAKLEAEARARQLEPEPPIPGAIVPLNALWKAKPKLREPVIEGLLRRGETMNLIAGTKIGKSFLAGNLAFSAAAGRPWIGFKTHQCNVLLIDNELHMETTSSRLDAIGSALNANQCADRISTLSLRGLCCDIYGLDRYLMKIDRSEFSIVIIDALYRLIPEGSSENDNAQMTILYNKLDYYADMCDCAFVVVHHSTKGGQSEKNTTDVGSGAGAISRAADSHLIIRPHEQDGLAVVDAATRSWKSPEPISISWKYPVWTATDIEPQTKQTGKTSKPRRTTSHATANNCTDNPFGADFL